MSRASSITSAASGRSLIIGTLALLCLPALVRAGEDHDAAPRLLNPTADVELHTATLEPINFSWEASKAHGLFDVELARDEGFIKIISRRTIVGNSFEMMVQPDAQLWWRVCPLDAMGRRGDCTPAASFTYRVVEPASPAATPTAPPAAVDPAPAERAPPTASEELQRLTLHVGPHLSFLYNFGQVATARGALELGYRWPVLSHYVGCALSVGYYTSALDVDDAAGPISLSSRMHGVPIDLIAAFFFTTDLVDLYGGAGPGIEVSYTTVQLTGYPETAHGAVDLGLVAVAGVERMLGPGVLFVDGRVALTMRSSERVERGPVGLNLGLGYRIRLW